MSRTINLMFLFVLKARAFILNNEKEEFCTTLNCEKMFDTKVCGIRKEDEGFRLKLFESECDLLKFDCLVENKLAYGTIDMEHCEKSLGINSNNDSVLMHADAAITDVLQPGENDDKCAEYNCENTGEDLEVCGIRTDGPGFRVATFPSECNILKHNCEENVNFTKTDYYICKGFQIDDNSNDIVDENMDDTDDSTNDETMASTTDESITTIPIVDKTKITKNLVILDGSMLDYNGNINETMDRFFALTHARALPLKTIDAQLNETTRRRLINIAGPVKVFKPWIVIPKNISTDRMHEPTLSSCFHKCPQKCPDTYAPVCGVPGIVAREPSLMFKNHCFMDAAQCKMRWEDKGSTSESSAYVESSFVICLGDELNGLYRFLPLVRTLQHMGRLKKKGHFRYRMRNMRFFNNLLAREPKLMG